MDSRGLRGLQVSIGTGWAAAVRMGFKILLRLASLRLASLWGSRWTRGSIQVIGLWYRILIFLLRLYKLSIRKERGGSKTCKDRLVVG